MMKRTIVFFALLLSTICLTQAQSMKKEWLNHSIDFKHIKEVVNTYHMFDASSTKVGSMIFGFWLEGNELIARDTSQFDDGSVYETAEFRLDITKVELISDHTSMKTANAEVDIDLKFNNKLAKGNIEVKRSTGSNSSYPFDQSYDYTVVRSEIYMLLHTLSLEKGDTINLKALVPNSMSISTAKLYFEGKETITTSLGTYDCDVFWLKGDGVMPENKIWISNGPIRKIIKFYVPAASLNMELVAQRASKK
jgi:hypothetical protein